MENQSGGLAFNPWDKEFRENPYPYYKVLLKGAPLIVELLGPPTVIIARYADVIATLRDHTRFSSAERNPRPDAHERGLFRGAATMLFSDPPVHTRLRRLVSRDFTPRRIHETEPHVREFTDRLLDTVESKGTFDVMADLANSLPVMVIAEMLGVPSEQYKMFKDWSEVVVGGSLPLPGESIANEIVLVTNELRAYLAGEIQKRRVRPGHDLISALIAARDDNEVMSDDELLAFVTLLLLAGNETTTNLIGNGLLALARHPEQMELLRRNPDLAPGAIEEMLRYDGPVQATLRQATVDAEIGGTAIPAGAYCVVQLGAANRDPAHFPDPDRFDIKREPRDHLAFSEGIHFCIGAPLARLEGAIAIGETLRRFPKLHLKDPAAPLTHKGTYFLRGLRSLPMALE
jgi:cytochrome P450